MRFMKSAFEVVSDGMTYKPSFMTICQGIWVTVLLLLQQAERM
jgi:hypothetical protein